MLNLKDFRKLITFFTKKFVYESFRMPKKFLLIEFGACVFNSICFKKIVSICFFLYCDVCIKL